MPFARPTLNELIDRTLADASSRLTGAEGAILRRSVIGVLSRALAGLSHELHGHLQYISRQVNIATADAAQLDYWASVWGMSRKPATYAAGSVTFTGTNTSTIPAGTTLTRSDGVEFTTDTDGTISGGSATVAVTCTDLGITGNTESGVTVSLASPIVGVSATATVAAGGIANGVEVETDTALRDRLLARIQLPPQGGAEADYILWATEVSAITRAWVFPQHLGEGTVGVAVVQDDDPVTIIPDNDKVQEVQDYIDLRRPVTADVTVFAPIAVPLDFEIAPVPGTQAVRDAIEAELRDLLRRESEPGGTILLTHIREAISVAAGETDHTLVAPVADVTHATGEIATFGTITWS